MNIYQTRNLPAHQLLCPDAQSTDPVDTKTHAMLDVHCRYFPNESGECRLNAAK